MLPFQQFLNYLRYSVTDNVIILASKIGIYLDYEPFKIDLIEAIQTNDVSRIDYVLAHMNRHHLGFMFLKHISIDERFMLASLEANNFKTIGFKFLNTFHQTHIGRNLIPTKTFATYIARYGVDEIDMLLPPALNHDYVWSQLRQVIIKKDKGIEDDLYAQRLYYQYFRRDQQSSEKTIIDALEIIQPTIKIIARHHLNFMTDAWCSRAVIISYQYHKHFMLSEWMHGIMRCGIKDFNNILCADLCDHIISFIVPKGLNTNRHLTQVEHENIETFLKISYQSFFKMDAYERETLKTLHSKF